MHVIALTSVYLLKWIIYFNYRNFAMLSNRIYFDYAKGNFVNADGVLMLEAIQDNYLSVGAVLILTSKVSRIFNKVMI